MDFPSPLVRGMLLRRHRRFLADVRLQDGRIVTAHCPAAGALRECSEPGSTILLSESGDAARRHPLTWELSDLEGTLVCINTPLCRRLMVEAVEGRLLPLFAPFESAQRDAADGRGGTVDLMLHGMERNAFVNLFHVTWAKEGTALVPDARVPRLSVVLRRLTDVAARGHMAVAIFLVQRGDCRVLKPAERVDADFTRALLAARSAGVELLAHAADVRLTGVTVGPPLPVSLD